MLLQWPGEYTDFVCDLFPGIHTSYFWGVRVERARPRRILREVSNPETPRAHFALFGFPVRIHPFFWVVMVMFGLPAQGTEWTQEVLGRMAIWVGVLFVSILWHELGHAFAMRRYGYTPWIELYGLGGRTGWGEGPARPSPKVRVIVSLAGPFAGFGLAAISYGVGLAATGHHWALDKLLEWLVAVNFIWGACNLVPMLPWDGGNALHGALDHLTKGRGLRPTAVVTIITALAIAGLIFFYAPGRWWPLLLCGLSFAIAVRTLRGPRADAPSAPPDDLDPMAVLASARANLERVGDPQSLVAFALSGTKRDGWAELAQSLSVNIAEKVGSPSQRAMAFELAAWAHLLAGDAAAADEAARNMRPSHDPSPILEATIAVQRGHYDDAIAASKDMSPEEDGARRLIRAYALTALGRVDEALAALEGDREAGASADAALFYAERYDAAASLGESLFERFGDAGDAYNTACSHSCAGRAHEGLEWLDRAVEAGYADLAHLESDDDLAAVRALDGYGPIRDRVSAG